MNRLAAGAVARGLALLLATVSALAQDASPPRGKAGPAQRVSAGSTGDYALGTWGGGRDRLAARGITFESYYVTNVAGNVTGGRRRGITYADNVFFGVTFDLEQAVGWRGARLTVSAINRAGTSLTERFIGSQYNSQQVFGGQNIFLYQVFVDKRLLADRLSLKFGRFGASDDFNTSPIYGFYMNNGIDGNVRNVLFDTQFSAYPFATWAVRARWEPGPAWNAQLGLFQTSDRVFDAGRHGLDWSIRRGDGTFLIAQAGTPPSAPRDGHYWIGASYSAWDYPRFGSTTTASRSYGFYAHADHVVYRPSAEGHRGLTAWAATGLYPQEDISIVPWQVNAGLVYRGPFARRPDDTAILGVIYGRFSRDYARTIEAGGGGDPRYEAVLEAAYRIQLRRYAYIQPDVQWVVRPGGTGRVPDAVVLGFQVGITF